MKKKFLPWLFLFLAPHFFYTASADESIPPAMDTQVSLPDASSDDAAATAVDIPVSPPDTSSDEALSTSMDTEVFPPDTYLPVVKNYCSLVLELLKMDYLYHLESNDSSTFPSVKKINWSDLLRANASFLYGIRLNQSRFAFCVGVGYSSLCYAFSGQDQGRDKVYKTLQRVGEKSSIFQQLSYPGQVVSRSALNIGYVDLLARLRFNSVLEESKEGFHAWLGFKLGIRSSSFTTLVFNRHGSGFSKVTTNDFNLQRFAFALQTAVGYSRFGLTGGFHLNPLFMENQGPADADFFRPFSFGIYVDLV